MSESNKERLLEAVKTGTLEDVKAAFEACSVDERKEYGYKALWGAAGNTGPHALDMVKLLMNEHEIKPDCRTLRSAAQNTGPCAFDVVKLLMERGANPHEKDVDKYTAFTESLRCGNTAIADYLSSCDDFLLSDLMPRPRDLQADIYKEHRAKAIARVSELVDAKGISFAKMVAADIEKILKSEDLKPTKEDIKVLQLLAKKIAAKDWASEAQVSSDDFLDCEKTR